MPHKFNTIPHSQPTRFAATRSGDLPYSNYLNARMSSKPWTTGSGDCRVPDDSGEYWGESACFSGSWKWPRFLWHRRTAASQECLLSQCTEITAPYSRLWAHLWKLQHTLIYSRSAKSLTYLLSEACHFMGWSLITTITTYCPSLLISEGLSLRKLRVTQKIARLPHSLMNESSKSQKLMSVRSHTDYASNTA